MKKAKKLFLIGILLAVSGLFFGPLSANGKHPPGFDKQSIATPQAVAITGYYICDIIEPEITYLPAPVYINSVNKRLYKTGTISIAAGPKEFSSYIPNLPRGRL